MGILVIEDIEYLIIKVRSEYIKGFTKSNNLVEYGAERSSCQSCEYKAQFAQTNHKSGSILIGWENECPIIPVKYNNNLHCSQVYRFEFITPRGNRCHQLFIP